VNIAELSAVGLCRRHHIKTAELAGLLSRLVICLAIAACISVLFSASARAQKLIQIAGADRTVMVMVPIGKSQDVRTDASFVDITVGDPEVADVNPLTDHTLSILGKKIGTTRVSVYSAGKTLVGIFDVEVSYDFSRLTN
jgi:pilus assembly protein CpaC